MLVWKTCWRWMKSWREPVKRSTKSNMLEVRENSNKTRSFSIICKHHLMCGGCHVSTFCSIIHIDCNSFYIINIVVMSTPNQKILSFNSIISISAHLCVDFSHRSISFHSNQRIYFFTIEFVFLMSQEDLFSFFMIWFFFFSLSICLPFLDLRKKLAMKNENVEA